MQRTALSSLMVVLGGATAASCDSNSGPPQAPDPTRVIGILQLVGQSLGQLTATVPKRGNPIGWDVPPGENTAYPPSAIEAADTVELNRPIPVTVNTIAPDGCWSDGIDVGRQERVVEFVPYDHHSGAELCTQMLGFLAHQAEVSLDLKGEWKLRARGRRVRAENPTEETPVTAERVILVR